ncbi:MAG: PAS domain S-box protein [Candidatus Aquicultor sp.]|nr:PAS domain S-box protein [Candidatus Aquicultor sp.]
MITLISTLAPLGLDLYKKQEVQLGETIEQLESTQRELHTTVEVSREQEKQLAVINSFSVMLSKSLEFEEVMKTTVDMVKGIMQVEVVLVFSLHENLEELRLIAYSGIHEDSATALERMRLGEGVCGRVAETGQPLMVDDITKEPELCNETVKDEQLKSEISVPLMAHGKIMGTLCVATRSERKLKPADVELLRALGNLIGVAMRNVNLYSERMVAAEQLRLSEKRYRQIFENAHDAIWVQDLSGTVIAANQAAGELFGYELHTLVGMDSEKFFPDKDYAFSQAIQKNLLNGLNGHHSYKQEIVREDGSKAYVMLSTNLVSSNSHPDGIQFIGRDITNEVRMQENQRFYLEQITKAHEEERLRISRDLHDSAAQSLIATLRSLEKFCEEEDRLSQRRLDLLWIYHKQLKGALQEIRQVSRDLRPSIIDQLGLLPAVEWLVEQQKAEHGLDASLSIKGEERRFSKEQEVTLFRIIQEALRNVVRHAEATEVKVAIVFKETDTVVSIIDNGSGFELPESLGELSRLGKLGVDGMMTRARLVGGTFDMQTSPGEGTAIAVVVPS